MHFLFLINCILRRLIKQEKRYYYFVFCFIYFFSKLLFELAATLSKFLHPGFQNDCSHLKDFFFFLVISERKVNALSLTSTLLLYGFNLTSLRFNLRRKKFKSIHFWPIICTFFLLFFKILVICSLELKRNSFFLS